MNAISSIATNASTFFDDIPLEKLSISPRNPRQSIPQDEVESLAASLWKEGLGQNLIGYLKEDGSVEITGGGRRLMALKHLAVVHDDLETTRPQLAYPHVQLTNDEDLAERLGRSENMVRKDLSPAQEILNYRAREAKGATPSDIAIEFDRTEAHVLRRLALASLPDPIIAALEAKEISLDAAKCFTVCNDIEHALATLETAKNSSMSTWQLKRMLMPDAVNSTDRRAIFIGKDVYVAAGGTVCSDLFEEKLIFQNSEVLEDAFVEALNAQKTEMIENGEWKWVEVCVDDHFSVWTSPIANWQSIHPTRGQLTAEQSARRNELVAMDFESLTQEMQAELDVFEDIEEGQYSQDQRAVAGIYIYVDHNGQLRQTRPCIDPKDIDRAVEIGVIPKSAQTTHEEQKPVFSQSLRDDLARVTLGAKQHALLAHPDLIVDLLAYQLSHRMDWKKLFDIQLGQVPNSPSTDGAGFTLDERLKDCLPRDISGLKETSSSFRAFRRKGQEHIRTELARFVCAQYVGHNEDIARIVDKETKPRIRDIWNPTADNFFKRVSADYMIELRYKLLDKTPQDDCSKAFNKLRKGEKAAHMERLFCDAEWRSAQGVTDAQSTLIDQWLPEGMA